MQIKPNGIITFQPPHFPLSTATPKPLPIQGLDFVAPYWFDDDLFLNSGNASNKTGNTSTVYYRETNDSFLITRATREIRKIFTNAKVFTSTHLFIVTWIIVDPENDLSKMVIQYHIKMRTLPYVLFS